jgi:hypothetical protein
MPDDFELAKSVYEGTRDLLCPRMELRRCPDYRETVLGGCGTISVGKNGHLRFRLSAEKTLPLPSP